MDHFEQQLARLMRDTEQYSPFGPGHRDRLRAGVLARRRVRLAQKAVGSVLAVAGLSLGLFLIPDTAPRTEPGAPPPRPASSPPHSSPGATPSPTTSATVSPSGPTPTYSVPPTGSDDPYGSDDPLGSADPYGSASSPGTASPGGAESPTHTDDSGGETHPDRPESESPAGIPTP
ncbi:cellulase [Streptomyces sp. XM83C]|jgi:hypothetical protein|uniref:Cellulase n=1 Tax=Streptomyces thermocoprophilus TaxID=78356 RepID=A0ABV5V8B8_9ACTN|nr:cellulase [Streptomyces sp. XM83C]MCK1818718.1 cellulase [Streptomyces sp. XM83C]